MTTNPHKAPKSYRTRTHPRPIVLKTWNPNNAPESYRPGIHSRHQSPTDHEHTQGTKVLYTRNPHKTPESYRTGTQTRHQSHIDQEPTQSTRDLYTRNPHKAAEPYRPVQCHAPGHGALNFHNARVLGLCQYREISSSDRAKSPW